MEPKEVDDMVKDMEESLLSGALTEPDRVRVKRALRSLIIDNYTRGDTGMLQLKTGPTGKDKERFCPPAP